MKVMVMIPTYNERENIETLLKRILALGKNYEAVVVDDDSPDGTWRLVMDLARENERIHLIRRINRRGRGSAGVEGFLYALRQGADYIGEMDADFSHQPEYLLRFLEVINGCDVVIGSRYVPGGEELNRSFLRRMISLFANLYIRTVLGLKIKDCTSGFRLFRRRVLEEINLKEPLSNGPSIVEEILYQCYRKGFRIQEVPIIFENRRKGQSTLNLRHLLSSLVMIVKIRFHYRPTQSFI